MNPENPIKPTRITYDRRGRMGYDQRLLAGETIMVAGQRLSRPLGMDAWEIQLNRQGSGRHDHGPTRCPGHCELLPPGSPLVYHNPGPADWHHQWCYFRPTSRLQPFLNWPMSAQGSMVITLGPEIVREVESCFDDLVAAFRAPTRHRQALTWNLLERLLLLCDLANPLSSSESDARLTPLLDDLHHHLAEPITVGEMAARCGLSPSRFSAVFQAALGCSPRRYLEQLRIEAACRRLLDGDERIEDIAAAVGFDNPLYFSRVFSRLIGEPPSRWRRRRSP